MRLPEWLIFRQGGQFFFSAKERSHLITKRCAESSFYRELELAQI
jgi:hypothetical protein